MYLHINLATTGAGGMDTGTAPATGWVALYAIYNPTNQASALLAVNATTVTAPEVYGGANMPTGYTASALVSVWKTTGASLFDLGILQDRHVDISRSSAFSFAAQQVILTRIYNAVLIPRNAKFIYGDAQVSNATGSTNYQIGPTSNAIGLTSISFAITGSYQLPFKTSILASSVQTISYMFTFSSGTPALSIYIVGYDF